MAFRHCRRLTLATSGRWPKHGAAGEWSGAISKYEGLYRRFPNLRDAIWHATSSCTPDYNCAAWAANDTTRKWWPDPIYKHVYYWPPGLPRNDTVQDLIAGFRTLGYELCRGGTLEEGWEKVAFYINERTTEPLHVTRQLPNGAWASKLGSFQDIEHHDLDALRGDEYGKARVFMRRPRNA